MILVTGATGGVGSEVVRLLRDSGVAFREARRPEFDFENSATFRPALDGVDRVFLVRPPALSKAELFRPFLVSAREAGVRQIVFLSLLGAEKNRFVPHRGIEDLIVASGIPYTFLRPGFFMQNLSTTHAPEIRERDEVFVPAGRGKTSFIDVRDIAAVAVKTLTESGHENRAYALTGTEALTYAEVAKLLSEELGREIRYTDPSVPRFAWHMRHRRGFAWMHVAVMVGIYTVAKLGKAGTLTGDLPGLLGRSPILMKQFIADHREIWFENWGKA